MAKSRTSNKTKSKKSKFPMWGIAIIVVAVVAVAGYAIVRFSQASTHLASRWVRNGLENCGDVNQKSGEGEFCKINMGYPVKANWSYKAFNSANPRRVCARLFFSPSAKASVRATANITGLNNLDTGSETWQNTTTSGVTRNVCRTFSDNFKNAYLVQGLSILGLYSDVVGSATLVSGDVTIKEMWLEQ